MSELPFKPIRLGNLEQQIDQTFDELIHGKWRLRPAVGDWQPDIDIYETTDVYIVEADVPGIPPQEIHVEVEDHGVTISGHRQSSSVEQSAQGVRLERRKGSFLRRFPLKHAVDPQSVVRTNEEGMLILRIPKRGA